MVPVRRILPDALVALLRRAPLSSEKVAFAWRTAVGPSLDRVTTIDLAGRVLRVGIVEGHIKTALLAGATLFALPSEHENFGIAALEALAAGTPVLLSPGVDFAQAALAAGLGYTAPLNVPAWRERLAFLLSDTGHLRGSAEKARCWVSEHYAWAHIADELVQRYRWVMAGCPTETSQALAPASTL